MSPAETAHAGDRVPLKTVRQSVSPFGDVKLRDDENDWLLIGNAGYTASVESLKIMDITDRQALVVCDDDPEDLGLQLHNRTPRNPYDRLDDLELRK